MVVVKEYLITVTAASIICGIVTGLTKKNGTISTMLKLLSGIFMVISMLSPVIRFPMGDISLHLDGISSEAENTVNAGKQIAEEEMKAIITSNTQAYILEKAEKLGADIELEVYLEDCVPTAVRIIGQMAPYTKLQLSQYISDNLGIAAEDQQWID